VSEIINGVPEQPTNYTVYGKSAEASLRVIPLQNRNVGTFKNITTVPDKQNVLDIYSKARTVGAGVRIFKTSTNADESGTLDIIYG